MNVAVLGDGTLAQATYENVDKHFAVVRYATPDADVVWMCYDTPIDDNGRPDNAACIGLIEAQLAEVNPKSLVLVSSQLPVGTIENFERRFPILNFAYSPENIRVATASEDFAQQARIVVGIRGTKFDATIRDLFSPFTSVLIVTDPETAEMVKHALNAYLAMNIAFINEIAKVAKEMGADIDTITKALVTERRISPHAPLKAGGPFGGGHLSRDLRTLNYISDICDIDIPLIRSISVSNARA